MTAWPADARTELATLLDAVPVPLDLTPFHESGPGFPRIVIGNEERTYLPGMNQDLPESQTFTVLCVGGTATANGYESMIGLRDEVLGLISGSDYFHAIQTREATYQLDELGYLPATEITVEGTP